MAHGQSAERELWRLNQAPQSELYVNYLSIYLSIHRSICVCVLSRFPRFGVAIGRVQWFGWVCSKVPNKHHQCPWAEPFFLKWDYRNSMALNRSLQLTSHAVRARRFECVQELFKSKSETQPWPVKTMRFSSRCSLEPNESQWILVNVPRARVQGLWFVPVLMHAAGWMSGYDSSSSAMSLSSQSMSISSAMRSKEDWLVESNCVGQLSCPHTQHSIHTDKMWTKMPRRFNQKVVNMPFGESRFL